MTCREKLKMEHPEKISDDRLGGCEGCPSGYRYLTVSQTLCPNYTEASPIKCRKCWDQEIPETENEQDHKPDNVKESVKPKLIFLMASLITELGKLDGVDFNIGYDDTLKCINFNITEREDD